MREQDERSHGRVGAGSLSAAAAPPTTMLATPGKSTLVEGPGRSPPLFAGGTPAWEDIDPAEVEGLGNGELAVGQGGAGGGATAAPASRRTTSTPKQARPTKPGGPAPLDAGHEAQLIEVLEHGDVPDAEFSNLLMGLGEANAKALYARLLVVPAPQSDRLAHLFSQRLPETDRRRIVQRLADMTKSYADARLWSELAPGEDTTPKKLVSRVDAFKGVVLRAHPAGPKLGPVLPFDTVVAVSRETKNGWYYVTVVDAGKEGGAPIGATGFIESYHVASEMPEPSAHLHKVAPNQLLKDISKNYYGYKFEWGHDARVFVQAIYHANKNRDVVFRQKSDLSVNKEALETNDREKALELWAQARVVKGQALWMPSTEFVDRLKAAGVIHHASLSKTIWDGTVGALQDVIDFLQYAGGFAVGLLEGAWGALEDLFTGVADLVKLLWTVVKSIFNDFSEIKAFAKKISEAWKNRDAIVQQLATQFDAKWSSKDDWDRGSFQGEVLGYIMTMAFITLATFGAGAAIAGAGRFGNFIKLIQFADAAGSIGTYTSKLANKLKLPKKALDASKDALAPKMQKLSAGGDGPKVPDGPGHIPGDAPSTPHVPRGPQKNSGELYKDPRYDDKSPKRHLEDHELGSLAGTKLETNFKKFDKRLKKKPSIAIGRRLASIDEGHAVLEALARGDASALGNLGIKKVPRDYDPTTREWALVEARDGFYVYAGRHVDIGLPGDLRVHAHTHPSPRPPNAKVDKDGGSNTVVDLDAPFEGRTYDDIIGDYSRNFETSGLAPSARDIHAVSGGGAHVIYTRYVHRGGGKIANPLPADTAPRIAIHMAGAKVIRINPRTGQYYYQVSTVLKDADGKVVWSGEMYAEWAADAKNGLVFPVKPAVLRNPAKPPWKEV